MRRRSSLDSFTAATLLCSRASAVIAGGTKSERWAAGLLYSVACVGV